MFKYRDDDLILNVSWKSLTSYSEFDKLLKKTWIEKQEKNLFRYKYRSMNAVRLPGIYQFIKVVRINFKCFHSRLINYCLY